MINSCYITDTSCDPIDRIDISGRDAEKLFAKYKDLGQFCKGKVRLLPQIKRQSNESSFFQFK